MQWWARRLLNMDSVFVAIHTKREQPSLGWKVASMLRRYETRVRNELGWWFTNVFRFFPRRALKTLQRLVNICIQIQESLSLSTFVCEAGNAVHHSMVLTGYLRSTQTTDRKALQC